MIKFAFAGSWESFHATEKKYTRGCIRPSFAYFSPVCLMRNEGQILRRR